MRKLILFLFLATFYSCGKSHLPTAGKTVFRYNESSGITSLDPAFASNQANIWACTQVYNGLVSLSDSLTIEPSIAKSWSISDDGRVYTFIIRRDVWFHDDPALKSKRVVTANDFVFSFNRIIDPVTASPGSWIFNFIEHDSVQNRLSIKAINDTLLTITLKKSFPPFLELLSSTYCSVVPHEAIAYYGKDFRKHPVGTGPFKYYNWFDREALILHKNNHYFEVDCQGNRLPYLDAVMVSFIPDKQSAFLEFLRGKLDFISGLDASYKDDLLTKDGRIKQKHLGKFKSLTSPY